MQNLKKYFIIALIGFAFLGSSIPLWAQVISPIRKQYAEIHEKMELQKKEIHMQNTLEMNLQHNVPGIGPQSVHYVLQLTPYTTDADGVRQPHQLNFATASYNIAAAKCYEEFLYNDKGEIIFVYVRQPLLDQEDTVQEIRMYYEQQKPIKVTLTKSVAKQRQPAIDWPVSRPLPPAATDLYDRALQLHDIFVSMEKNLIP